ncbi:MAG: hypothetical protein P9L92_20310 [Candidatus Electryonea clarkiae]|nr:hypothetical protein [Candidatus Electryonea clarkiae]MDP8286619.1 hypothetical protein [Candidatus Electryonea clarkiae]
MKYSINHYLLLFGLTLLVCIGCSSRAFRFSDSPPITDAGDNSPIPSPESNEYEEFYYYFNNLVRRPIVHSLDLSRIPRSADVNSMDNVPKSSWFTPRLGYRDITPEELLHGVEKKGAPESPYTVVGGKLGGTNPGFIVKDSRGIRYIVKFDPPKFPAIQTTTNLIVNRLFWGFGYNVPEDYLVFFKSEELKINPESGLTQKDLESVLSYVAEPVGGFYRSTFSMFIPGKIIGPTVESGTRSDDPNDRIAHQDRRVLRALRVFGAFTNHSDIRIDNTLDVFIGENDEGYIKHYMLDFGEAFGGHGAEHDWLWDGHEHYFNFGQMFKNLATFGIIDENWEEVGYTGWESVGAFESTIFNPESWRETYQFLPVRLALPDDDYWAAKILGALKEDHLRTLVKAAKYPDPEAEEYIIATLMQRKEKIIEYCMSRVAPVELRSLEDGRMVLEDFERALSQNEDNRYKYVIKFYNDNGKVISPEFKIADADIVFTVPVSVKSLVEVEGYLRIDVRRYNKNNDMTPPAQFHIRELSDKNIGVVGIVH